MLNEEEKQMPVAEAKENAKPTYKFVEKALSTEIQYAGGRNGCCTNGAIQVSENRIDIAYGSFTNKQKSLAKERVKRVIHKSKAARDCLLTYAGDEECEDFINMMISLGFRATPWLPLKNDGKLVRLLSYVCHEGDTEEHPSNVKLLKVLGNGK